MNSVIKGCLASLIVIGSAQAKEQMVTFHVSATGLGYQNIVTIGNSFTFKNPCNGCTTDPDVLTRIYQTTWQKGLPVPQNSILFAVYRSEEVDQLISKLEGNIAKLSDMNDALTARIDELSKRIQELESARKNP
jgi:hypothetical protein